MRACQVIHSSATERESYVRERESQSDMVILRQIYARVIWADQIMWTHDDRNALQQHFNRAKLLIGLALAHVPALGSHRTPILP